MAQCSGIQTVSAPLHPRVSKDQYTCWSRSYTLQSIRLHHPPDRNLSQISRRPISLWFDFFSPSRPEVFTELTISRQQSQFSFLLSWLRHHRLRSPLRVNQDWCHRPHSRRSPRPRLPHPRLDDSLLLARHQHHAPQTPPRRRRGFGRSRRSLAAVVIPRKPFS